MRKVWNNANPPQIRHKSRTYICFKACLELCEVFRNESSHKTRPNCISLKQKEYAGKFFEFTEYPPVPIPVYLTVYEFSKIQFILAV
jgi:hypothetical protein